jgi:serine/threonine protein kinase
VVFKEGRIHTKRGNDETRTKLGIGTKAYIAMEYIKGKELFDVIDKNQLKPIEKKNIITQLFEGLAKINELGISYNDLKAENILYNTETKKITFIDFGLASNAKSHKTATGGDPGYASPEIYQNKGVTLGKSDTFSLAMLLCVLIDPEGLPDRSENATHADQINFCKERKTVAHTLCPGLYDLLQRMMVEEPKDRISSKDAVKQWKQICP